VPPPVLPVEFSIGQRRAYLWLRDGRTLTTAQDGIARLRSRRATLLFSLRTGRTAPATNLPLARLPREWPAVSGGSRAACDKGTAEPTAAKRPGLPACLLNRRRQPHNPAVPGPYFSREVACAAARGAISFHLVSQTGTAQVAWSVTS
jgi:hypothetical protein